MYFIATQWQCPVTLKQLLLEHQVLLEQQVLPQAGQQEVPQEGQQQLPQALLSHPAAHMEEELEEEAAGCQNHLGKVQ